MTLIVALDFDNHLDALALVKQLDPSQCALKVGSEMFTYSGPDLVRELVAQQFRVFLDLKLHDIPNTVARACVACAKLNVWMVTLHISGGVSMMRAAKAALQDFGQNKPLLMGVTVLTSFDDVELSQIGVRSSLQQQVTTLAQLAYDAELDGIVCSAHEVSNIKSTFGKTFLTVTPGIRLPGYERDDQVRTYTPRQAISAGSDYLVVGRPITTAAHPVTIVRSILDDISTNAIVG